MQAVLQPFVKQSRIRLTTHHSYFRAGMYCCTSQQQFGEGVAGGGVTGVAESRRSTITLQDPAQDFMTESRSPTIPEYQATKMHDKVAESKLQHKESSMSLGTLMYEDFENQVKKYGYIGVVTHKHMDEVSLSKKFLKTNELQDNQTRLARYFNSELIMIKDKGQYLKNNSQILSKGNTHCTTVYDTHKVLLMAFLFCKHTSYDKFESTLWSLLHPAQTKYVAIDQVIDILRDLQTLAIDIPAKLEQDQQVTTICDNQIEHYFRNISSMREKVLHQTHRQLCEKPKPAVIKDHYGKLLIQRSSLIHSLRDNWTRTWQIRNHHMDVYFETKAALQQVKEDNQENKRRNTIKRNQSQMYKQ